MIEETNNKIADLENLFRKHLTEQYKKGYLKGLEVGSKTFVVAIKDMIEDKADVHELYSYCNKALGLNEEKEEVH